MDKKKFLKEEFTKLLATLQPDLQGKWGKMNAQQMVEHMSFAVRWANGRIATKPVHAPEITQRLYQFMVSEKPFKENTPNQLLSDDPYAWKNTSMAAAITELQLELDTFFKVYADKEDLRILNPFFGNLNFADQVQLLHKHATHHARQFGLVE